MARLARFVLPGIPHHVTQRGNRRQPVFFGDDDREAYLALIAEGARASGTSCLAWCLMDNHIHLILVPRDADGLRAMLGDAHRRYTRQVNFREGWRGYLFQGPFAPVAAKMVGRPQDWRWSSAASHMAGKHVPGDALTDVAALSAHVRNWRALWKHGLEAADLAAEGEEVQKRSRRACVPAGHWPPMSGSKSRSGLRAGPCAGRNRGRKKNRA